MTSSRRLVKSELDVLMSKNGAGGGGATHFGVLIHTFRAVCSHFFAKEGILFRVKSPGSHGKVPGDFASPLMGRSNYIVSRRIHTEFRREKQHEETDRQPAAGFLHGHHARTRQCSGGRGEGPCGDDSGPNPDGGHDGGKAGEPVRRRQERKLVRGGSFVRPRQRLL